MITTRFNDDSFKPGTTTATDLTSGEESWRLATGPNDTLPGNTENYAVSETRFAFGYDDVSDTDEPRRLLVFNATDGKELWRTTHSGVLGLGDDWLIGVKWTDIVPADPAVIEFYDA